MDRILHIIQESFQDPRHRYLGSVKDYMGRHEYFASRGIPVDHLIPEEKSDDKLAVKLQTLDLKPYHAAVFELHTASVYPKSLSVLRRRAPHLRRWTRPTNAEFLHQIDLFRAHRKHPYARDRRDQLVHDTRTGAHRLYMDWVCARKSDAVLSISDWETAHYWPWLAGRRRTRTVPYFLPAALMPSVPREDMKRALCVCPLSTAKSIRPFPLDAAQNFVLAVRAYGRKPGPWSFAMTGSTRVKTVWSHAIASTLHVPAEIEQLGFIEDPVALLAQARAVAVLSDFGYGFKTKILDAIAARCWVLVPPALHRRLPSEVQPYCIIVGRVDDPKAVRTALEQALEPLPDGDPNAALRTRAFAALDALMESK